MTEFTKEQVADWNRYEKVRVGGRHNMWTPQAREATGLSRERYMFSLSNYSEIKEFIESREGGSK